MAIELAVSNLISQHLELSHCREIHFCHPSECWDPAFSMHYWMPAFADDKK